MDVIDAGEGAAFHESNDIARIYRHRWQRTAVAESDWLFFDLFFDIVFLQAEFAKGVEKLRDKRFSFAERARELKQLLRRL